MSRTIGWLAVGAWLLSAPAYAQPHGHGGHAHGGGATVFVGGYFYDPFYGPYPWWPAAAYPYAYYPVYDVSAGVRVEVKPRQAAVYVDAYYAGIVDDFDGFFQRLTLPPGQHDITLYLEGYRTIHQQLYLSPGATYKVQYTMEALGPGEVSEPPPAAPPPVPLPPPGSYTPPRTPQQNPEGQAPEPPFPPQPPQRQGPPPPQASPSGSAPAPGGSAQVGTIVVRVQPGGADVLIDGERWITTGDERLVVQVEAGRHLVEIHKAGYRSLTTEVDVTGGATSPLNISLTPE